MARRSTPMPTPTLESVIRLLAFHAWRAAESDHQERVDALTAGHRARRADGRAHPVEDFLFTYYQHSPARLRRWHPGPGVALAAAAGMPRASWTSYRKSPAYEGAVELDSAGFMAARGDTVQFIRELLVRTADRPARLRCFGLHEWAMVHQLPEAEVRHRGWPLRLGSAGTDEVVRTMPLRCTHFDAYRFFTPAAAPLNELTPTRVGQLELEQAGCLHAAMDVYRWAFKMSPAVPSELVADCFELAREIRVLDMRASPYDLRDLGYEPVPIETTAGRVAYAAAQRSFADRSNALRHRLVSVIDATAGVSRT